MKLHGNSLVSRFGIALAKSQMGLFMGVIQ
jgi:hypothetical protein